MIHTATNVVVSVATISQGVKLLVSSSKTKIDPLIGALKALLVCRSHNSVKQADPLAWLPQEERHRVRQRQGSLTPDFIMQSGGIHVEHLFCETKLRARETVTPVDYSGAIE
jgi:hypothetical protein